MTVKSLWFNKPRLVEKVKKFHDHLRKNDGKIGTYHRGIELNFNNACNLRCKYCFTNSPKGDHVKDFLPIPKLKEIADELLHEMESKLIYVKETQARVAEAASKSASKKK